jgi:hypothetical protein
MSSFGHLEFGGGLYIFGKFLDPCYFVLSSWDKVAVSSLCCYCGLQQCRIVTEDCSSYLCFEQDTVQAHITENSVLTVLVFSFEYIISRRLWPSGLNMICICQVSSAFTQQP